MEQISDIDGDISQFDPVLTPIEEYLPSCVPTPSTQSDIVYITQCKEDGIKVRAEHNDALKLAKHYRYVAENHKMEILSDNRTCNLE